MAVEFITPFSVFLFFLSSCQAKPENFSEAQCKVLTVGEGTASEFRVKASEKGVRLVYLNLEFRNDSYRPLESEFLPYRWVWASLISEPMLSMSYDYDILSLGLLKYQTRSMDVLLEDQPSGCLANLNSSCQNKVVGRALLNMTQLNSGEPPDRNVVCVAIIEDYVKDFLWGFFDGNVKFRCCNISKQETEESAYIQCELEVQVSDWFKAFNGTLNLLTVLMMLYCPAFLLFLPDSIFNLQEECKKEERRENEQQSEDSHHRQSNQKRSRYGSTDEASANITAENGDSVPLVTLAILTQSQQANSQIGEDTSNKHVQSLLYLDEPNPITFSYFLRTYTKERTELFSFHSKFAFLWYCVIPIFVYLRLGLNYIVESKFMEAVHKNPKAYLVGPLFSYRFCVQDLLRTPMALAPLILILFSSPKDFLITVTEDIRQVKCPVCRENTVSVGEDMLRHLRKLAVDSYKLASCLINFHQKALAKSIKFFTHYAIEKMVPPWKRAKTPFIVLWVLFWDVVLVIVVGVILGGVCFCVLLIGLVFLICCYSPWFSLMLVCLRKLRQMLKKWSLEVFNQYRHYLTPMFIGVQVGFQLLLMAILTNGCLVGSLSCRCITRMFGLVILGLVLNASIAGPFLALSIAALTNIYLCYYNLQMYYRDVKEMISEKWQTLDGKREHGAIPEDLFWRICSEASNSNRAVPTVRGEVNRMLSNMAIILIFLFLVFCSVFLVTDASSMSAVPSTIAVFLSGAIPSLLFKGLTHGKRFTGETRVRMIREIEEAVIKYKENIAVTVELYNLLQKDTLSNELTLD
nr:uncharacterized protein LOC131796076 [Pocillopora verrucosa]XP_058969707.1 uncharacterized protein LOC131796076 [Pocillopora verrucosa]